VTPAFATVETPDRFLVSAAVLGLVAIAAEERSVVCAHAPSESEHVERRAWHQAMATVTGDAGVVPEPGTRIARITAKTPSCISKIEPGHP
jgi:hypothetical protein